MEELFMTEEDKSLIESLVMSGVNRVLEKLPCIKHGENIVELKTAFNNHCNNEKERREDKKVRLDIWKIVISLGMAALVILEFIKKV
jgi:hypothetical protein